MKENRGGKRQNSGRKQKYGEPTETISFRVPVSMIKELKEYIKKKLEKLEDNTL